MNMTRKTTTTKTPTTSLHQDLQKEKRGRGFQAPGRTTMKMTENLQWGMPRRKKEKGQFVDSRAEQTCQYVGASQKPRSSVHFPTRFYSRSTIIAQSFLLMHDGNQATFSLCLFSTFFFVPIRKGREVRCGAVGWGGLLEPDKMHMYSSRRFPARHQTNVSAATVSVGVRRAGEVTEGGGSN